MRNVCILSAAVQKGVNALVSLEENSHFSKQLDFSLNKFYSVDERTIWILAQNDDDSKTFEWEKVW